MADEILGDLIVEMKLDDSKYRSAVKSAITTTVAQAKQASRDTSIALNKGFDVAQATQGLRALQGSLYLVTGETGFLVLEAGRTAAALGKMAQASGGVGAALGAAAIAGKGFLASIGPVGIALLAVTGAYAAYRMATARAKENNEEFLKSLEDIRKETDALGASEEQLRAIRLREAAKKLPFGGAMPGGQPNPALREMEEAEMARSARKQAIAESVTLKNVLREREAARRASLIDVGLASASDFQSDPATRLFMRFKERADRLRSEAGAESGGFGISSINSNAFRLGAGSMGSVIGGQTEQVKTNEKLDVINETLKREFQNLVMRIVGDPTLGGFNVPGWSGLPGL